VASHSIESQSANDFMARIPCFEMAQAPAAVKRLVDEVWNKGGKLIPDTAFGIPDETPIENVRAMFDAARKYAG
jgi:uroporphyrinogen-III decarboxylase